jgi:MFS family permease
MADVSERLLPGSAAQPLNPEPQGQQQGQAWPVTGKQQRGPRWRDKTLQNLGTIFAMFFMFHVASSSTFSPGVLLLRELACEQIDVPSEDCSASAEAESAAAGWGTIFSSASGALGLVCTPLYAMASDRWGRKRPLLLIPCINALQVLLGQLVLLVLPPTLFGVVRIWWYFGVVVLGSISGGVPFVGLAFAAVADETRSWTGAERARCFGIVQSSIFLGLMVGPVIGGQLVDRVGVRLSLVFSGVVSVLLALVALCVFRETLEPARRTFWRWMQANPFGSLGLLLHSRVTISHAITMFAALFASVGCGVLQTLYWQTTFGWTGGTIGLAQTLLYGANAFGLIVLLPVLQPRLGSKGVIVLSTSCAMLYHAAFGVVGCRVPFERCTPEESQPYQWQIWVLLALGIFNTLFFPGLRTTTCAIVGPRNYGKALGAIATTQQIVGVAAGPLFFGLQSRTSEGCTGAGCFLTRVRGVSFQACTVLGLVAVVSCASLPTAKMRELDAHSIAGAQSEKDAKLAQKLG